MEKLTVERNDSFKNADEYAKGFLKDLGNKNIEIVMKEQTKQIGNVTHEHYLVYNDGSKNGVKIAHLQPRQNHLFKCRIFKDGEEIKKAIDSEQDKQELTKELKAIADNIQNDIAEKRQLQQAKETKAKK